MLPGTVFMLIVCIVLFAFTIFMVYVSVKTEEQDASETVSSGTEDGNGA